MGIKPIAVEWEIHTHNLLAIWVYAEIATLYKLVV